MCSCVPSNGAQDIAVKDSGVRMNAQHIIHRFIATNLALLLLLLLLLQQQFVLPSFLLDELFVEQFRRDGVGLFDFLVEIFLKNNKKNHQQQRSSTNKILIGQFYSHGWPSHNVTYSSGQYIRTIVHLSMGNHQQATRKEEPGMNINK